MDQPLRTKEEALRQVEKRFQERAAHLPSDVKEKVKKKFDEWITDDALGGLTYEADNEVTQDADDWFDGALDYLKEMGEIS